MSESEGEEDGEAAEAMARSAAVAAAQADGANVVMESASRPSAGAGQGPAALLEPRAGTERPGADAQTALSLLSATLFPLAGSGVWCSESGAAASSCLCYCNEESLDHVRPVRLPCTPSVRRPSLRQVVKLAMGLVAKYHLLDT